MSHIMNVRTGLLATASVLLFALLPTGAASQLSVGPQVTFGSDSGLGIGARAAFRLRADYEWLDGTLDANYSSPDEADSWIETNANVRVRFPFAEDFETMIGAGLNASFVSVDEVDGPGTSTDTSFGINVLGGVEYPRAGIWDGRAFPFAEVRAVLGGAEQVVFSLGLTFGSRPSPPVD